MNAVDKDAFAHALGQTMLFFGKDLDKMQFSFWYSALQEKSIDAIKKALLDYVKVGKYAPRPANILEIVDNNRHHAPRNECLPPPPATNCPPEVAKAWMWFINRISKGTSMDGLFDEVGTVDISTQERYLHIVNHEAHKYGTPEAIPEEFKLLEVWA